MIDYSVTIVFYGIYLNLLVPYAIANATRLGLTTEQTDELTALLRQWNAAYPVYINPVSYGKLSIATINNCYSACKKVTDALTQQLKTSTAITLVELDYIIFDIHIDSTTKKKQVIPKQTPGVILKSSSHLDNFYKTIDLDDPTSGAKPKGTKRVTIYMLVQKADAPPPTIDMLLPEMTSGTMNFDVPFTSDQVGMIAYIAVCFSNDAGGGVFSAIIACPII